MDNAIVIPQTAPQDIASIKNQNNYTRFLKLADPTSPLVKEGTISSLQWYISNQDADKLVFVGTLDTDTDGIKKGIIEAIPLACRPHAMLLKDNKVDKESFVANDAVWAEIAGMKRSKISGAAIGLDILYYIPPDQLNFNFIKDEKFKQEAMKSMANGVLAVFYYKNSSAKFCPDHALPKNNKLTRIKIKGRLTRWETYIWASPQEHIIVKEGLTPDQAFTNAQESGSDVTATIMGFSSAKAAAIIDAPALPR